MLVSKRYLVATQAINDPNTPMHVPMISVPWINARRARAPTSR
ncbi:hypothetical protein [Pseudomonas sp. MM211]|nr:hypothetical protein [Pseudomonas sp. MM211]